MPNLIKNFLSGLQAFGSGRSGSALGVDIGSSAIKVVEIKKKGGRASLETYGAIALGPYAELPAGQTTNLPAERIIEALKEVLSQSGVGTASGALSIPVQSSLVFTVSLPPSIKESDLPSVVPTEARKYIPVPIGEVSLDYFVLPRKEPSFEEIETSSASSRENTEVLVVAIQNDAISRYRSIVSGSGLSAGFFEIEIFSSIRSNFGHELSPVLLVDLGAGSTKLSLVEFGTVVGHHTVPRGGADISASVSRSLSVSFAQAEELKKDSGLLANPAEPELADIVRTHIDYIFSEANNALLSYEKKHGRAVSKVIMTGGGSLLKGLEEVAAGNFRAEVEVGRPFSKVSAPDFLRKVLDAIGPEFSVALGLALRKLQ